MVIFILMNQSRFWNMGDANPANISQSEKLVGGKGK